MKIATLAGHPNDNLRMLELVRSNSIPAVGLVWVKLEHRAECSQVNLVQHLHLHPSIRENSCAGQIPWKQLVSMYRYDSITPSTKLYGVIADPVGHSLSPVVHNAACAAAGA